MDPVRALALLWRACMDIDGAAINAPEDHAIGNLLEQCQLGSIVQRDALHHQRPLFQLDGQAAKITYFVANDQARELWDGVLAVVREHIEIRH